MWMCVVMKEGASVSILLTNLWYSISWSFLHEFLVFSHPMTKIAKKLVFDVSHNF